MILGLREKVGGFTRRSKVSTRVDFVRRRLLWGCILSVNPVKLILIFNGFHYSFCELNLLIKQSSRCLLNQALANIWISILLMNVKRSLRVDNVMSMGSLTWLRVWNTWQLSLLQQVKPEMSTPARVVPQLILRWNMLILDHQLQSSQFFVRLISKYFVCFGLISQLV